jgi:hypothetical protein
MIAIAIGAGIYFHYGWKKQRLAEHQLIREN